MAVFTFIPVSAAGFEPVEFSQLALKGLFLYSDFNVSIYNSTNSIKTFYFNKSTSYSVTPVSSTDELHVLQYQDSYIFDKDNFVFDQNAYYSKNYLYSISQDNYGSGVITNGRTAFTCRFILDFPINLYLNNTSLKFYVILPSSSDVTSLTFSGTYIDSNDEPHAVTTTNTVLVNNSILKDFVPSNTILNDNFKSIYSGTYISTSNSFRYIQHINQDLSYQAGNTFPNRDLRLFEVSLNFGDDYYDVSSVYFQVNLNMTYGFNNLPVYCEFDTSQPLTFYQYVDDSGSVDLSYIEDMLDSIGGQLEEVNDKLDIVTGEPPSEAASEFDSKSSEVDDLIDEALENAAIVHEAEQMPTTYFDDPQGNNLPQNPQNGELDDYNSVFTIFSQFPLINQIIFSGGVCLVFFTLLRRW